MAHFRATISGGRGEASRLGTKGSGIRAHAHGWTVGGQVEASHNLPGGRDIVRACITGGSNGAPRLADLGAWACAPGGEYALCIEPPDNGPLAALGRAALACLPYLDTHPEDGHQLISGLRAALVACGFAQAAPATEPATEPAPVARPATDAQLGRLRRLQAEAHRLGCEADEAQAEAVNTLTGSREDQAARLAAQVADWAEDKADKYARTLPQEA